MSINMMPNSILGITFFALLAASSNMQAEELKRLQIGTPPAQLLVPQSKTPAPAVGLTASPVGLKDAKQTNDSAFTRTPFNHYITTDPIDLHVEAPIAGNSSPPSNYEALGRPIPNKGTARTEITCIPPQLSDGGNCVDPPANYEALGRPIPNKGTPRNEITCKAPQVSDGMGKCITPLTGPPLDCPAPAVVINNQCVMQPK